MVKWPFCAHVKPNTFTESLKYHYISKSHFIFHWKLQYFRWSTYIRKKCSFCFIHEHSRFSYFRKWNWWSYFLFSLQRTLQRHESFAFADVQVSGAEKAFQIPMMEWMHHVATDPEHFFKHVILCTVYSFHA